MSDMRGGTDHIGNRVKSEEYNSRLSKQEAKEQLLYDLRHQIGRITFSVKEYDEDDEYHGDGLVIANINGEQADHYIYYDTVNEQ